VRERACDTMISIHDLDAIERLRQRHKIDPQQVRRLRIGFYKKRCTAEAALGELQSAARGPLAAEIDFHTLTLEGRHDSQLDGATKLLFRTSAGLLLESVILRMTSGRTALCLSTQVGCAARCDFCATGKMGVAHDLAPEEILDQVVQANQILRPEGRSVRNLVFMGMGEPFHNERALYSAVDVLIDRRTFAFNPRRLMISTVGIPAAMVRWARAYPDVRMALSLHSARQEVRHKLMPIAARHALPDLRAALEQVAAITDHEVMIEYLMLADLNDSLDDARTLAEYLSGIPVHINLIPYNPIESASHLVGSDARRRADFSDALKHAGLRVTTRYSLGADIAAACGQLARRTGQTLRVRA
jgi:23S rRNA (adenine2503-C2)-methyltransferase